MAAQLPAVASVTSGTNDIGFELAKHFAEKPGAPIIAAENQGDWIVQLWT